MVLDTIECDLGTSQLGIFNQDKVYQSLDFLISYELRELHFIFLNHGVKSVRIVVDMLTKGKSATNKLVKENSQRPKVCLKGVSFAFEHLGGHVMGSSDDCKGLEHVGRAKLLGSTHID